uniref:Uncharacterized protein n=1 Tax=Oryza punctata TaxID=4537 RepID=A0A0E0MDW9_ORYPU
MRQILLQEIINEELLAGNTVSDEETINDVVDTDDEANQAEEHESWQHWEMAMIKRRREQSSIDDKLMEDKNLTADCRKKWMRFMQRYYDKGCFFQQDADDMHRAEG